MKASCCEEVGKIPGKGSSTFLISLKFGADIGKLRKTIRSFVCKWSDSVIKDDNFNVLDWILRKCQSSGGWAMSKKFCYDEIGSILWVWGAEFILCWSSVLVMRTSKNHMSETKMEKTCRHSTRYERHVFAHEMSCLTKGICFDFQCLGSFISSIW